jgi:hypothetical protein
MRKFDFEGSNTKQALEHYYNQKFELSSKPNSWRNSALILKRAAEYIYAISLKGAVHHNNKFLESIENGEFGKQSNRELTNEECEWLRDGELNRIYYMLVGLALENLFKGILINKNPTWITTETGVDTKLTNHRLTELAQLCNFTLDEDQRFILEFLRKDIEWRAKYPIPQSVSKLKVKYTVGGATNVKDAWFPGYDLIEALFNQLINIFPQNNQEER